MKMENNTGGLEAKGKGERAIKKQKIIRVLKYSGGIVLIAFLLPLSGYIYGGRAYKIPTQDYLLKKPHSVNGEFNEQHQKIREEALSHPLYNLIPRHREQIRWWDVPHWITWNLFGNDDDGIFAEETGMYSDEAISFSRFLKWTARNPAHNFTFYTIGSAERNEHHNYTLVRIDSDGLTCFKEEGGVVFGKGKNAIQLGFNDHKPFISLKLSYFSRQLRFYFGWRERGNFGIKFQPAVKMSGVVHKTSKVK